nr:MAG TPA: hypothetical protein [Caudoviricetes sp.]
MRKPPHHNSHCERGRCVTTKHTTLGDPTND